MNSQIILSELKEKIIAAFNVVEYPGDDKIAIKQWYLDAEHLDGYVGRKRENVTVDFINDGHRQCTTFMTQEALRYYLPVYLILCAEHALDMDIFSDEIIMYLTPPIKEDYEKILEFVQEEFGETPEEACIFPSNHDELEVAQNEFFSFIKMLSKEQREVVYYFLVYYEGKYQDGDGKEALDRFWEEFKDHDFEFRGK